MARIRSPNYPAMSLGDAVQRVGHVFERERQHPMQAEVVVKGLGYGGLNGASLSALSAIRKYGLIEKNGEDYCVSTRAVSILHPHDQAEKEAALRAAAREPALFSELLDHFKGSLPSDDNLRAYLVRRGFSDASLDGVIQAFRDTMALISPITEKPENTGSAPLAEMERSMQSSMGSSHARAMSHLSGSGTVAASAEVVSATPLMVSFNGHQVVVSAKLETGEAVDRLIRVLQANKPLLPEKSGAPNAEESDKKAE